MLERWILRRWKELCIGCVLMGICLRIAYAERGYMTMGGEWLVIPVVFVVADFIRWTRRTMRKMAINW